LSFLSHLDIIAADATPIRHAIARLFHYCALAFDADYFRH
jgi:hypothetical protein